MAVLMCDEKRCIYRNVLTGECGSTDPIYAGDFYEYDSEDLPCFGNVLKTPEYQTEFWIANRDRKTGREWREKKRGKQCYVNGIVFFVCDPLPSPEYWPEAKDITGTEVITGMAFPMYRIFDEAGLAAIKRTIAGRIPVMELPEYDAIKEVLTIDE